MKYLMVHLSHQIQVLDIFFNFVVMKENIARVWLQPKRVDIFCIYCETTSFLVRNLVIFLIIFFEILLVLPMLRRIFNGLAKSDWY